MYKKNQEKKNGSYLSDAIQHLELIMNEYSEEETEVKEKISWNLDSIKELSNRLDSLHEKEDIDIKIFSPRNIENQYEFEILENQQKIKDLESENREKYKELNRILHKKEKLNIVKQNLLSAEDEVLYKEEIDENDDIEKDAGDCAAEDVENAADANSNYSIVLDLQEKDRKRIADELHDTTVQDLVHIIQKTELCMKFLNQDQNRVNLELASMIQLLRSIIKNIRNTIYDLRPMSFDDFGFSDAIQRLADDMMTNSDFNIQTDMEEFPAGHEKEFLSLYRIISELIRNCIYHSGGTKIYISVRRVKAEIVVHVIDNGKGFDSKILNQQDHFGLQIVKNRVALLGGRIHIESNDKGTDVEIKIKDWFIANDTCNVSG